MEKDRLVGAGILIASIAAGVVYALLFYLRYSSMVVTILVSAAFFVLLGIVGWVGWTMATTPSPKPIEGEVSAESTEEKPKTSQ
jgi:predicted DNA-binding transcriptional regulator